MQPSNIDPPSAQTFLQLWGHWVLWIPWVILFEVLLAYRAGLGPGWVVMIATFCIITEIHQFTEHAWIHHPDHPICTTLSSESDEFGWAVLSMLWVAILCGAFAISGVYGPRSAFALTVVMTVGQICTSAAIHWVAHGTTVFKHGPSTWSLRKIGTYVLGVAAWIAAVAITW